MSARAGWSLLGGHLRGRRRALLRLGGWSVVEMVPVTASGLLVARATDEGFLRGDLGVGLAWLGLLAATMAVGALGASRTFTTLADVIEPLRDTLVRLVVTGTVARAVAGRDRTDTAAVARLTSQTEGARQMSGNLLVALRHFLFTLIATVAGLTALLPVITAIVLGPVLLCLAGFVLLLRGLVPRARDALLAAEEATAGVGSLVAGVRDTVACGAQERAENEAVAAVARQADAERRLARVGAVRTLLVALGTQLPLVAVLAAAPWLVSSGSATPGAVLGALTYLTASLAPALSMLVEGIGTIGVQLGVVLARIVETSRTDPPADAAPRELGAVPDGHALTVRGLTFAYGAGAEPIVRDLDLDVAPGEHLAVVGPSGIGKSTLAGLLTGSLTPADGGVRLGGVALGEVAAGYRHATMALIPQEAYVFGGTVRENLTYLCPPGGPDDPQPALDAMPALQRLVDELGGPDADVAAADLTEARRQLLALGRVYLSPASVVILDEATSHLDPPDEADAEEAFRARPGALVVIAHRISSALRADRVVLVDGASAQVGTHDELLATSPLYADLVGYWTRSRPGPTDRGVLDPAP